MGTEQVVEDSKAADAGTTFYVTHALKAYADCSSTYSLNQVQITDMYVEETTDDLVMTTLQNQLQLGGSIQFCIVYNLMLQTENGPDDSYVTKGYKFDLTIDANGNTQVSIEVDNTVNEVDVTDATDNDQTATLDDPNISAGATSADGGQLAYGTNVDVSLSFDITADDYLYSVVENTCYPTTDITGATRVTLSGSNVNYESCLVTAQSGNSATVTVNPGLDIYRTGNDAMFITMTIQYEPKVARRGLRAFTKTRTLAVNPNTNTQTTEVELKEVTLEDMRNAGATDDEIRSMGFDPNASSSATTAAASVGAAALTLGAALLL